MPVKILKMIDIATCHLSPLAVEYLNRPSHRSANMFGRMADLTAGSDGRHHIWLELGGESIVCVPHQHGWIVAAHAEFGGEDEAEVPAELKSVIEWARAQGADWIMFDSDGQTYEELQSWDW